METKYLLPLFLVAYVLAMYVWKQFYCWFTVNVKHANMKTKIVNFSQDWIYFRPFGLEVVLSLDSCGQKVKELRIAAYKKLAERLNAKAAKIAVEGAVLVEDKSAASLENKEQTVSEWLEHSKEDGEKKKMETRQGGNDMADCRFQKVKVLGPLFKELEIPGAYSSYMQELERGVKVTVAKDAEKEWYLSADAVRVFPESFYQTLEKDIAKEVEKSDVKYGSICLNEHLLENQELLRGLVPQKCDKVRYALSGSEAVEIACKDVRMNTNKRYIVRFKAAYHGHTCGSTNFDPFDYDGNFIYLKDMSEESLAFIEEWHFLIAGVMVNPMMHFTGVNAVSPPGEKTTLGKRVREYAEGYDEWLHKLSDKCQYVTKYLTPVAFMLDDVYFALRHHNGLSSCKYFKNKEGKDLDADVIVFGKGIAGGWPLSIVCGKERFMLKQDTNFLLKLNRTVGTLSAYNYGLIASNCFLKKLWEMKNVLKETNDKFDVFVAETGKKFESEGLPLQIRNFANTFSFNYTENSVYNSLYVQFLIANGVFVSNQSTGKFNLLPDWKVEELSQLGDVMVKSGVEMREGGFFEKSKGLKKGLIFLHFFKSWCRVQYDQIMVDKEIDIEVSHNHPVNKWTHFWSSIGMILFAYTYMAQGYFREGFTIFLITHVLRQAGHFFYEHQDRDWEKQKFGHKDGSKKAAALLIVGAVSLYYYCYHYCYELLGLDDAAKLIESGKPYKNIVSDRDVEKIAVGGMFLGRIVDPMVLFMLNNLTSEQFVSIAGLMTVFPHFVEICFFYGWIRGWQWLLKILTDPFTDLLDFYAYFVIHPKWFLRTRKQFNVKYQLNIFTKNITDAITGVKHSMTE